MKLTMNYSVTIFILLATFVSCSKTMFEEYKPEFNVFSVIKNDTKLQTVIVNRTYKMDEPAKAFVEDATTILSTSRITDTLEFSEKDSCYHSYAFDNVQPLEYYDLTVIKDGLDTLVGSTKVPGNFDILFPQNGDTITSDDMVTFSKSYGAIVYRRYIYLVNSSDTSALATSFYHEATSDSVMMIPFCDHPGDEWFGCFLIKIVAFDTNYYKYHCGDVFGAEDSIMQAGVKNGVGLFGSAWVESVTVFLVEVE